MEKGAIEMAPLAYMRGRTLNDAFIILDEAQNSTAEQMKMFLTRLGFNSKMVITGDITQIDLPSSRASGLIEAGPSSRASPASASCTSTTATSCGTGSCRPSSAPTTRTRPGPGPGPPRARRPPAAPSEAPPSSLMPVSTTASAGSRRVSVWASRARPSARSPRWDGPGARWRWPWSTTPRSAG